MICIFPLHAKGLIWNTEFFGYTASKLHEDGGLFIVMKIHDSDLSCLFAFFPKRKKKKKHDRMWVRHMCQRPQSQDHLVSVQIFPTFSPLVRWSYARNVNKSMHKCRYQVQQTWLVICSSYDHHTVIRPSPSIQFHAFSISCLVPSMLFF